MSTIAIVFSTITGNAFRLAEAVAQVIPDHVGPYNIRYVNREMIDRFDTFVLSYWCNHGTADDDTLALLQHMKGKKIIIIGTLGAVGMHAMKKGWASLLTNVSYLPMTTPDIVTGVSLMLMFVFMKIPLGKGTMLMAHIAFDTPYVLFAVMPRLRQMNPNLYEAALDLGCHPLKALYKVILPEIDPGIVTGALLTFTMSLDDFVISYFTSSTDQNLSMIVYSAARRGVEPSMYALSTIMFVIILLLLLAVNRRSSLEEMK